MLSPPAPDATGQELEVWAQLERLQTTIARALDRALEGKHGLSLHAFELLQASKVAADAASTASAAAAAAPAPTPPPATRSPKIPAALTSPPPNRPSGHTEATTVDAHSTTLASALELEHREIDQAIETYLAAPDEDGGRSESLTRAFAALRRHIYLEEEFLFPPMRAAGFVAPIFVMLREHGELWDTMASIERALTDGTVSQAAVQGECKWLLAQLERHNSKEEPILYPHADSVLGAPASADLRHFLETGRLPDHWKCAAVAQIEPAVSPPDPPTP